MPPSASDTFIILKPQEQWPAPKLGKTALLDQILRMPCANLPGNAYEFTSRSRCGSTNCWPASAAILAIKVFGDDFEPLLRDAG